MGGSLGPGKTAHKALTSINESPPEIGHILGEIQSQLGIEGARCRFSVSCETRSVMDGRISLGPNSVDGNSVVAGSVAWPGLDPVASDQLSRSITIAMPWPPPTHIVSRPNCLSWN